MGEKKRKEKSLNDSFFSSSFFQEKEKKYSGLRISDLLCTEYNMKSSPLIFFGVYICAYVRIITSGLSQSFRGEYGGVYLRPVIRY